MKAKGRSGREEREERQKRKGEERGETLIIPHHKHQENVGLGDNVIRGRSCPLNPGGSVNGVEYCTKKKST
jgi:hypothetical protein